MREMTPYQQRIVDLLEAGGRLVSAIRFEQFGRDIPVTVLVDGEGAEIETVRSPTVKKLVEMGWAVDTVGTVDGDQGSGVSEEEWTDMDGHGRGEDAGTMTRATVGEEVES